MAESSAHESHSPPTPRAGQDLFASCLFYAILYGLLLLGVAGVGFGVWSYVRERTFLARSVHVQARVTDVTLEKDPKYNITYTPTYEFADREGTVWSGTGDADTREYYKIGSSVPVVYDPDQPSKSQIESFWSSWGATVVPISLGLVCLTLVAIPALSGRSSRRASAAGQTPYPT